MVYQVSQGKRKMLKLVNLDSDLSCNALTVITVYVLFERGKACTKLFPSTISLNIDH